MLKRDFENTQMLMEGEIITIFVSLAKWRKKPTKETIAEMDKNWEHLKREGGNLLQAYWTFGRYDAVIILDAPNENTALKDLIRVVVLCIFETLLSIP